MVTQPGWRALHLGYAGGKRLRKHFYGSTRREVADKLTMAKHELQRGLRVGLDGRQTLESFLHQWLRDVVKPRPPLNVRLV